VGNRLLFSLEMYLDPCFRLVFEIDYGSKAPRLMLIVSDIVTFFENF